MIGSISTINPQKRCGYIKEKGKNFTYYFGFNSISEKDLQPKVGQLVSFDLYRRNENESVAVRIRSLVQSSDDGDFVDAVVLWYKPEKNFGYVKCENSCDAFLHVRFLHKVGLNSVRPGEKIKVKVVENKYPGKMAVSQVMLYKELKYSGAKDPQRQPKYPPPQVQSSCTSDELTAIPCSSASNEKRSNATKPQRPFPRSFSANYRYYPPRVHDGPSPRMVNSYPGPSRMPGGYGCFRNTSMNYSDGPPLYISSPYGKSEPRMHNSSVPHTPTRNFNGPLHTHMQNPGSMPMRMPFPSPTQNHPRGGQFYPPGYSMPGPGNFHLSTTNSPRFMPRQTPRPRPITNPEYAKVKQQIFQKEGLLKTLNVRKLPDAGQRLYDQIKELKEKLKTLSMYDESESDSETKSISSKAKSKHANGRSLLTTPHDMNAGDPTVYSHNRNKLMAKQTELFRKVGNRHACWFLLMQK